MYKKMKLAGKSAKDPVESKLERQGIIKGDQLSLAVRSKLAERLNASRARLGAGYQNAQPSKVDGVTDRGNLSLQVRLDLAARLNALRQPRKEAVKVPGEVKLAKSVDSLTPEALKEVSRWLKLDEGETANDEGAAECVSAPRLG